MSLTEKLELLVHMDPSQAVSAARNFATETDRSMRQAESSLKRFSSAGLKLGGAGLGIGGLLTTIGSAEQEASNQLDAAIRQVGQSVSDYRDRIEQAISTQEGFGTSAASTQDAIATLTVAYGDTGAALDRMQLAADIAARKHISLSEAATIVARAHAGSTRAFKQFGVEVQVNADGTKNYEGALDTLSQKLQGQAAASADSFAGRMRALGAVVHDGVAQFGEHYGPAILGVSLGITALSSVTAAASSLTEKFAATQAGAAVSSAAQAAGVTSIRVAMVGLLGPAGLAAAGLGTLLAVTGSLGGEQDKTAENVRTLTGALREQGAEAGTHVNEKVAELLTTTSAFPTAFKDAHANLTPFIEDIRNGGEAFHELNRAGVANNSGMGKFIQLMHEGKLPATAYNNELLRLAESGQITDQQWGRMFIVLDDGTNTFSSATDQANLLDYAQQGAASSAGDLSNQRKDLNVTLGKSVDATRSVYDAERTVASAHKATEDALHGVETAQERVIDAQHRLDDALKPASADDATKANLDVSDAQLRVGDSADAVAQAEKDLNDLRAKGGTPEQVAAAERKLAEARNTHERAVIGVRDAEQSRQDVQNKGSESDQKVIDARKNLSDAEQGVIDAKGRVVDAYAAEGDAVINYKKKQDELAGGTQGANSALDAQIQYVKDLAAAVDPNSEDGKRLAAFLDRLLALKGIGPVAALGPLGSQSSGSAPVEEYNSGGVRRFASGGLVPGPRGRPMLAVVHGGEYVDPNGYGARGQTSVVHQHFYGDTSAHDQQLEAVRRLRREAMLDNAA